MKGPTAGTTGFPPTTTSPVDSNPDSDADAGALTVDAGDGGCDETAGPEEPDAETSE